MSNIDINKLEPAIFDLFKNLGFKYNNAGYRYAFDFVRECFNKIPEKIVNWYEQEAKRYGKTAKAVERSLRYSCQLVIDADSKILHNIFDEQTIKTNKHTSNYNFLVGIYYYMRYNASAFGILKTDETESR